MDKLWTGRFKKALDSEVNDFNSSIRFDSKMAEQDITGSIAHAAMLGKQGLLQPKNARRFKRPFRIFYQSFRRARSPLTRPPKIFTPLWRGN